MNEVAAFAMRKMKTWRVCPPLPSAWARWRRAFNAARRAPRSSDLPADAVARQRYTYNKAPTRLHVQKDESRVLFAPLRQGSLPASPRPRNPARPGQARPAAGIADPARPGARRAPSPTLCSLGFSVSTPGDITLSDQVAEAHERDVQSRGSRRRATSWRAWARSQADASSRRLPPAPLARSAVTNPSRHAAHTPLSLLGPPER